MTKDGLSNEDVRRDIEGFFRACREMADWLWQNTSLSKSTVMKRVRNSHYLRLADAIAQTTKHHTRTVTNQNPNPITAGIAEIRITGDGARVRIDWSRPSGSTGQEMHWNLRADVCGHGVVSCASKIFNALPDD